VHGRDAEVARDDALAHARFEPRIAVAKAQVALARVEREELVLALFLRDVERSLRAVEQALPLR
jgi:hypothetical protein